MAKHGNQAPLEGQRLLCRVSVSLQRKVQLVWGQTCPLNKRGCVPVGCCGGWEANAETQRTPRCLSRSGEELQRVWKSGELLQEDPEGQHRVHSAWKANSREKEGAQ